MKNIINAALNEYNLIGQSYHNISDKSAKLTCSNGSSLFIKKTDPTVNEKYKFLNSLGISNILYPINNYKSNYVSASEYEYYYLMPYIEELKTIDELKVNKYYQQLQSLHNNSYYRKELTPLESRKKLEDIYNYLQYKFNVLESFVRNIEEQPFDEYSIVILKDYQYILTAKNVMGRLNRQIIDDVKAKKSVNRAFIHNNPKLNHLINSASSNYFISLERAKIGIVSLDMAKFYIETEDVNIKHKELVENYFRQFDDNFYFDYFCFLVMLYYIKSIVINGKDYVSSQSFIYAGLSLKKFIEEFNLK